jgi:hypothetical protein
VAMKGEPPLRRAAGTRRRRSASRRASGA